MKHTELPPPPQPPLLRLILFLGKPLGIDFVPQHNVRVIYRMGKYAGCKGPGLIYYNRLTESLGPMVFIGGQISEYSLDNVISRDVLPVTMTVSTTISYDPALGVDLASVLTRIPKAAYVSIAGTYIRWGLLAAANQYNAAELTQSDVRAQIETAVRDRVNDELKFLGLKVTGKLRITAGGDAGQPARAARNHRPAPRQHPGRHRIPPGRISPRAGFGSAGAPVARRGDRVVRQFWRCAGSLRRRAHARHARPSPARRRASSTSPPRPPAACRIRAASFPTR